MAEKVKEVIVKKPPIETASWCFRDKEEDGPRDINLEKADYRDKLTNMIAEAQAQAQC